ncbi:unnamed protein product [Durusdinium trenchii]|uniref:Uncharacterized protein n=1 Tax=Durusdinium trenchii TaxID=1381693 RepID=A0ABP0NAH7_9DINO
MEASFAFSSWTPAAVPVTLRRHKTGGTSRDKPRNGMIEFVATAGTPGVFAPLAPQRSSKRWAAPRCRSVATPPTRRTSLASTCHSTTRWTGRDGRIRL